MFRFTGLLLAGGLACAGPVDFGLAELNAALAARNLHFAVKTELSLGAPQTFLIEPYATGTARIAGGDLRGLMYGLLEAADQIRETGRFKKAQTAPVASIRGVRAILHDANFQEWYTSETFWRDYFKMLARNRFNRFTLAAPLDGGRNLHMLHFISQTAAEYGVDFTLELDRLSTYAQIHKVLTECPAIRSIEMAADAPDREEVSKAISETGHRIMLDLRSASSGHAVSEVPERTVCEGSEHAHACAIEHLSDSGAALLVLSSDPDYVAHSAARLAANGSSGLEIDVALDDPSFDHFALFYAAWGRYSYDPKSADKGWPLEVAHRYGSASAHVVEAYHNSGRILLETNGESASFIASAREAVENRLNRIASAKQTPLDRAALLTGYGQALDTAVEQSGASLDKSTVDQFHALSQLARDKAADDTTAYQAALKERVSSGNPPALGKPLPRPTFTHSAPISIPSTQPLTLTLRMYPLKDATTVRLYYRCAGSAEFKSMEKQAAAPVDFAIPPSDLAPGDLVYYFEVLNHELGGWFAPDQTSIMPYFSVHIVQPDPSSIVAIH